MSLKDVKILAYHRDGPVQEIEIELADPDRCCPKCAQRGYVKDRPSVCYTDLTVYGRPIALRWRKHRWQCLNPDCAMGSWTSQDKRIASPGMKLTTRAAKWATKQVGTGRTVSEVAKELGCDWHTVNDTITIYGKALLEADRKRLAATNAIGLDETKFVRHHHQRSHYVTTVCDTANHQIIDIVPSRDFVTVAHYLNSQSHQWKQGIKYATLDMSPTYRAVFNVILPNATQIADHFHVITLANRALDNVRRRVQQQQLGHRGRKQDPLYRIRRLLTSAEENLSEQATQRITAMLTLGDPGAEVAIAYRVKERLRQFYQQPNITQARLILDELITTCTHKHMPHEVQQLGRTLKRWYPQILAYHHQHLSNSITEAMNNLIKRIKRIGYGFTNFENYRIRCLLYAGKPNWRILNSIFP